MQGVALSYPKNAAKFLFPIFELMGNRSRLKDRLDR